MLLYSLICLKICCIIFLKKGVNYALILINKKAMHLLKVNVLAKNYSKPFWPPEKINEINSITITRLCYQLYLLVRDHNNMLCQSEVCQGLINLITVLNFRNHDNLITVLNLRNHDNLLDIILKYDGEIDF